jgi:hypothetical protein
MSSEDPTIPNPGLTAALDGDTVVLPRPTAAPLVLSLGLVLLAAGVVTGTAFLVVGALVLVAGLGLWVADLLPGRGHVHEPLAGPARRPRAVVGEPGTVGQLQAGMPGYRMRLPEKVHPISAGIKGGIVGGLVMPLPALAYGLLSGHGLWYPVNLLAGMVLPGVDMMSDADLGRFHASLLVLAILIHAVNSLIFGLVYGVLLPTLPHIPKPLAWGGLLMPVLWTGVSYGLMRVVNPVLNRGVDWPWFIVSQNLFGVVAAFVVMRAERVRPVVAGLLGGILGGLLMPVPAFLWGLLSGRGVWYPINLLAGMVLRPVGRAPAEELMRFHADWLVAAIAIHAAMSAAFGLVYGVLLPRLPPIPAALAWGGLLMPMMWTGVGFGLMGVINPLLQQRVSWPWFIVSQFVFGVVAALVVVRSEKIYIQPAGRGPDRVAEFVAGSGEGQS